MKLIEKLKNDRGVYECECGSIFTAFIYNVKSGNTRSCGCYFKKRLKEVFTKHGLSKTKIYKTYHCMINRCYSPVDHHFCNYGGRGITVCDEWKSDFMSFFKWAIASGHRDGLAIDRIDNSGNYNPQNCRWVTRSENAQNQRQLRVNNKSGYRGVYFDITRNKWVSAIESKGRKYHLGTFSVPEDAAKAYNDFVLYNKTFHPLNTIQ